ncbi:MAG: very short patch repair endonuclease [Rhodobacteraceae bacterium]|nr:very short patch repair endonuclease [Paracoccaceae bacterium]
MADTVDQSTRSRIMARIGSKNTKPELTLRKALHARGLRYRLHSPNVAGRPDLVFAKYRAAVFVHGCFWHRHPGCPFATTPATRTDYWLKKFSGNVRRDAETRKRLAATGWRVAVIWECSLKKPETVRRTVDTVVEWLKSSESYLEV